MVPSPRTWSQEKQDGIAIIIDGGLSEETSDTIPALKEILKHSGAFTYISAKKQKRVSGVYVFNGAKKKLLQTLEDINAHVERKERAPICVLVVIFAHGYTFHQDDQDRYAFKLGNDTEYVSLGDMRDSILKNTRDYSESERLRMHGGTLTFICASCRSRLHADKWQGELSVSPAPDPGEAHELVIYACQAGHAVEVNPRGIGVFQGAILSAFAGSADADGNYDGTIDGEELANYLQNNGRAVSKGARNAVDVQPNVEELDEKFLVSKSDRRYYVPATFGKANLAEGKKSWRYHKFVGEDSPFSLKVLHHNIADRHRIHFDNDMFINYDFFAATFDGVSLQNATMGQGTNLNRATFENCDLSRLDCTKANRLGVARMRIDDDCQTRGLKKGPK